MNSQKTADHPPFPHKRKNQEGTFLALRQKAIPSHLHLIIREPLLLNKIFFQASIRYFLKQIILLLRCKFRLYHTNIIIKFRRILV